MPVKMKIRAGRSRQIFLTKRSLSIISNHMKKKIDYPAEITFKSVFLHDPELHEVIRAILAEQGIDGEISHKPSRNSKYISYTITAEFDSESRLDEVCLRISSVQGFIMMI